MRYRFAPAMEMAADEATGKQLVEGREGLIKGLSSRDDCYE